jgi:arabinofuranosyltransferase
MMQISLRNLFFVFVIFALAFVNTAWVGEDAYITFRVVDNALHGHGLVWNPGERVQVYTHPLWFFLLLAGSALFDDPYYVSLGLSFLCLAGTIFFTLKILHPCKALSLLLLSGLLFSRAFVDYSSSGLENPLSHLLIALFLWVWFKKEGDRHFLFFLTLISAAIFLNRPDGIVLIFPALCHALLTTKIPWQRKIGTVSMALSPIFAWVSFSLVYYGAPLPNTALAKAATGIDWRQYALQAWHYFLYTFEMDFVTAIFLIAGGIIGFFQPSSRWKALSSGIVLWGIYLCMVGADYMGGRFFSAPVLFAAILCAQLPQKYHIRIITYAVICLMIVASPQLKHTLFSPFDYRDPTPFSLDGITNSRGIYYTRTGLRHVLKNGGVKHAWLSTGYKIRTTGKKESKFYTGVAMGLMPYAAGPAFHWIDFLVLTEPFRARLPTHSKVPRIGHYERAFPEGYIESVLTGQNRIVAPALARLYDDVLLATTGNIFRRERFAAIFRLNTGFHKNAAENFDKEAPAIQSYICCATGTPIQVWRIDAAHDFTLIEIDKNPNAIHHRLLIHSKSRASHNEVSHE